MVAGAYLIIHQFEVFLFTPLIIKNVVGLSPLVVILAALIGFELGGFWGLVLAIPVAVFIMELMSDLEKRKFLPEISNDKNNFYITTTLPYVNAPLHIGHALEFVRADTIARYKNSLDMMCILILVRMNMVLKYMKKLKKKNKSAKFC